MHHMRGIADQSEVRRYVALSQTQAQRKRSARGGRGDSAETKIERRAKFSAECFIIEREQAFGLSIRYRPDDRAAAVRERKKRDRATRQEALPCGVFMSALGRDVRNDCALRVVAV